MASLALACPSFREQWSVYVTGPEFDAEPLYVHLGKFARHLVRLALQDCTDELPAVFAFVERMYSEGDPYAKGAATIALLEGIQNHAGWAAVDASIFVRHLGPDSAAWWQEVEPFWKGEIPSVGAGLRGRTDRL